MTKERKNGADISVDLLLARELHSSTSRPRAHNLPLRPRPTRAAFRTVQSILSLAVVAFTAICTASIGSAPPCSAFTGVGMTCRQAIVYTDQIFMA